ncbi:MAG: alpha/beta fold hydrolase [Armatimonadota bacterium]
MIQTLDAAKRQINVDGVNLAYEDYGYGNPVVFIHGFPTSTYSWSRVAKPLSNGYRCISFDMMGFGDSDKPLNESYTITRQADLIIEAISQLGLKQPVLVGHSMGGGVCLDIARRLGAGESGVAGLFLADPACYMQQLPWFFLALKIPLLPQMVLRRIPPILAFWMVRDTAYHRKSGMKLSDILEYVLNVRKPGAAEAFVSTARDITSGGMEEVIASYPSLSMPIQIIWGRQDKVIPPKFGKKLCREAQNADLHIVENCRHTPQEEHPEETYRLLESFLKKIS